MYFNAFYSDFFASLQVTHYEFFQQNYANLHFCIQAQEN
jgi:hypothetical protein